MPTPASPRFTLLTASLVCALIILDTNIVAVSLPSIARDLSGSFADIEWVVSAYMLAFAALLLPAGSIADRFGRQKTLLCGLGLFILASIGCGAAPNALFLDIARAIKGVGAALLLTSALASIGHTFHDEVERAKAWAFWGACMGVAMTAAPTIGGLITEYIGWRWIFYLNLPVGLLAGLLTWGIYRQRETPIRKLPIDTVGLSLLVLWVGALQLMLDKGKELDWFASGEIITLCVLAIVSFVVFLVWELTDAHPVVDLRLFMRRNFAAGTVALSIAYGLFFGNVVLLPLWLQQWMGYTATSAGMALAPVGVFAILLTPLVGKKVGQWDPRRMATGAFIVFSTVLWMRSQFTVQTDFIHILIPTLLQGAAMAFFFIPLTTLTLAGIAPERIPAAAGLSNFVRITAGAMGTSIATTLWESRAAMHHAHLTEGLVQGQGVFAQTLDNLTASGLTQMQALAQINRLIDQQAFTRAANDIFLGSAGLFLLLIGLIWLTRRPARTGGAGAADAAGAH